MRSRLRVLLGTIVLVGLVAAVIAVSTPRTAGATGPTFTFTPLNLTDGSSEPEISIGGDATMALVPPQWLFDPTAFGPPRRTSPFGATPRHQGIVGNTLQHPVRHIS